MEILIPSQLRYIEKGSKPLQPVSYSASQTAIEICQKIYEYPEQRSNTQQAFEGKVIDFISINEHCPLPATLSEFADIERVNHFFITTRAGGFIKVERLKSGKFIVIEAFDEQNQHLIGERS